MRECPNCGAESAAGKKFCAKCGAPVPTGAQDVRSNGRGTSSRNLIIVLAGMVVLAAVAVGFLVFRPVATSDPVAEPSAASSSSDTPPADAMGETATTAEQAPDTPAGASESSAESIMPGAASPEPANPGFIVETYTVTDIPAVQPFSYQTATTRGFAGDVQAQADVALAELTDPHLDEWRETEATDCDATSGEVPCGSWRQTVSVKECVEPYQCLSVLSSGVFPGAVTQNSSLGTFVMDPATGEMPSLEQTLGSVSVEDFLGQVNARLAKKQEMDFSIGCSDSMSSWNDPVTLEDIKHWLPTTKGISIWFDEYQVMPGAAGVVGLLVPWESLAPGGGLSTTNPCTAPQASSAITPAEQSWALLNLCPNDPGSMPEVTPGNADPDWTMVVQVLLHVAGIDSGPVDGEYGAVTQGAVKQFQRQAGIVVDAQIGPQTWGALRDRLCS
jgi:hypothetical protein